MAGAPTSGMSLVALLESWQGETRDLLQDLRFAPHPEGVLPSDDLTARSAAVRRLRTTTMPRETLKQRWLWPAIRDCLPDGHDIVAELKTRKHAFEVELVRLRWADERSILFDRQVGSLVDQLCDDLACEARLLPRLAAEIPGARADQVAGRLAEPGFLPVGPHPELPEAPWLSRALSPAAALADRIRDRFTTAPG